MADSLGKILTLKEEEDEHGGSVEEEHSFAITKEEQEEHYFDQLLDFLNESDSMVNLKALDSVRKLVEAQYMDVMTLNDDVIPIFISLIEPGFEEDQSLRFFSEIYGRFVYTVSQVDNDFVRDNFELLIKTYFSLCLNKDRVAQKSAVYNFPCFFKLMLS